MWPLQWASIPPLFVGFEEASTGNQGSACVSFWREEGVCALELSVQNHTHTHLPPAVHHKPPASHLLRTSWCGAQTHDNLCNNLTSLSSYFLLASGGNPLFTWQEHQACMQRFPAVALPLRTCFSAFIQLTLFFPFPKNCAHVSSGSFSVVMPGPGSRHA